MLLLLTKDVYHQHSHVFREAEFQIKNFGSIFNHEEMTYNIQVQACSLNKFASKFCIWNYVIII
jgi:hypothetical protein